MQYAGQELFPQSFELISDNTGRDAASANVGLEALADRTQYLRTHGYAGIESWFYSTEGPPVAGVNMWPFNSSSYAPNTLNASALSVSFPDTRPGDEFAIDFFGNTFCTPAAGVEAFLAVHATDNFGGGGVETKVPSALWRFGISGNLPPAMLTGRWTAQAPGTTRFRLLGRLSAPGNTFGIAVVASLRVLRFRPK